VHVSFRLSGFKGPHRTEITVRKQGSRGSSPLVNMKAGNTTLTTIGALIWL
jgi:hypothetical protein